MFQTPFCDEGINLKKTISEETASLSVRVSPGCPSNGVFKGTDGRINFRLTCLPVEGKANKELIKFVSKKLKIRQSDVSITRGQRSRDKNLVIQGLSMEKAEQGLLS